MKEMFSKKIEGSAQFILGLLCLPLTFFGLVQLDPQAGPLLLIYIIPAVAMAALTFGGLYYKYKPKYKKPLLFCLGFLLGPVLIMILAWITSL